MNKSSPDAGLSSPSAAVRVVGKIPDYEAETGQSIRNALYSGRPYRVKPDGKIDRLWLRMLSLFDYEKLQGRPDFPVRGTRHLSGINGSPRGIGASSTTVAASLGIPLWRFIPAIRRH